MGRLDIGYLLSVIKKKLMKYLPKQIRKPLILLCSVIGLYFYYKMMLHLSSTIFKTPSRYLLMIENIVVSCKSMLLKIDARILAVLMIAGGYLFFQRYLLPIAETKERNSKSIYYEVNGIISLLYIVITIAAFLPLMVR